MATITQGDEAKAAAPQYKTVSVGPLKVRVLADAIADGTQADDWVGRTYPTVESLADDAMDYVGRHAQVFLDTPFESRWRALLSPKHTRAAAQSAVTVSVLHRLRKPDGSAIRKGEVGPLVTQVRKVLVAQLRERKREQAREERVRERERLRNQARDAKARQAARERADRKACAAILPAGVKITKALSKDATQPLLGCAYVVKVAGGWELQATNNYTAVRVPLEVTHPSAIAETVITAEALKTIEKHGAFRVLKNGAVQPLTIDESLQHYEAPAGVTSGYSYVQMRVAHPVGGGYTPPPNFTFGDRPAITPLKRKVKQLRGRAKTVKVPGVWPKAIPASRQLIVRLDADMLADLAHALGGRTVDLVLDSGQFKRNASGAREWGDTGAFQLRGVASTKASGRPSPGKAGTTGIQRPIRRVA